MIRLTNKDVATIAGGGPCVCTCDSNDMLREEVLANNEKQCEMRCLPYSYKCYTPDESIPIMQVLAVRRYDSEHIDYDFGGF